MSVKKKNNQIQTHNSTVGQTMKPLKISDLLEFNTVHKFDS